MNDCITTTKQSTTYFLGYTVLGNVNKLILSIWTRTRQDSATRNTTCTTELKKSPRSNHPGLLVAGYLVKTLHSRKAHWQHIDQILSVVKKEKNNKSFQKYINCRLRILQEFHSWRRRVMLGFKDQNLHYAGPVHFSGYNLSYWPQPWPEYGRTHLREHGTLSLSHQLWWYPEAAIYHTRPCAYQWFQGCACKVCETHRLKVKWQKRTG